MKPSIRLVLGVLLLLSIGTLIVGALGPQGTIAGSDSPYLSKLSDLAVTPALAVPCNHSVCVPAQGNHYACSYEGANTHCLLSSDRKSCTTLTGLTCQQ